MYLVLTLRLDFYSNIFPQDKVLCSYIAVIPEIPESFGLKVEAKFFFKIYSPTVNAPGSTNKVFIFK